MSNRAAKYELLYKSLKKNFKPLPEIGERTVLEHLIYACCLEDARADQADEAFAKLQQAYFDWNEVRVTTVIELGEALSSLPNATQAGHRIKRCLQSLFEARYQYDIEDMKKANLGKATDELTAWKGISPFILNYVSQNALGGHAIPVDSATLEVLTQAEIITPAEAEKKSLPGIERAITKNKGFEFASLLHQFAIEFHQNAKSPNALAVFKELGVSPKPKVVEKPAPPKATKPAAKATEPAAPAGSTSKTKSTATPAETGSTKKTEKGAIAPAPKSKEPAPPTKTSSEKTDTKKKPDAKVADAKPSETKKPEPKKPEPKKPEPAKAEVKKVETKKPEPKKAEPKKEAAKKPETKPAAKKPDAKAPVKKSETKTADKKPQKTEPPKTKAKPPAAKPSPTKGTKSAPEKQSTNVKITKKKPR
jgi:endonuclease III